MSFIDDIQICYAKIQQHQNYSGPIYTFDLDKTYLDTKFERLDQLIQIPFEKAENKQTIPGVSELIKELCKKEVPLFFISGSPKLLREAIHKKLTLDGIDFYGILLKDFSTSIRKLQFKNILNKIGYKLAALLYARSIFPTNTFEVLFGDDSEYDAIVYSFYSDILALRLHDFEVLTILHRWGVNKDEFKFIQSLLLKLYPMLHKKKLQVKKIFIHMASNAHPPDDLHENINLVHTYNYFQTAFLLYNDGYMTRHGFLRILSSLIRLHQFQINDLIFSVDDLMKRGLIESRESKKILSIITKNNPLMLPSNTLNFIKNETNNIIQQIMSRGKLKKSKTMSYINYVNARRKKDKRALVDFYLQYEPQRKIK